MTMGGIGSDEWGSFPWGGSDSTDVVLAEAPTLSESLEVILKFKVSFAQSVSLTEVDVTFSHALDLTYGPQFLTTNFTISPPLPVSAVQVVSPKKIRLTADYQAPIPYTLSMGVGRSQGSDLLDPDFDTVVFAGSTIAPVFQPQAQRARVVTVLFSQPVLNNAGLTDPINYRLTDLQGNSVVVTSVTVSPVSPIRTVTLTLASDMTPWSYYAIGLGVGVLTTTSIPFLGTRTFQWMDSSFAGPIRVGANKFSGEISGGLHGNPLGQVFFSPSLENAISGSSIQVESVQVCTRAEDTYMMPDLPDPNVFMLDSAPLDNPGFVLFAPAWQLGLVQMALASVNAELIAPPQDALMDVRLEEPIDITRGGFLDDPRWVLFNGVGTPFTLYSLGATPDSGPATYTIQPSDMVDVADQLTTIGSYVRTISDDVAASDSISREEGRTLSDSVAVTDDTTTV